MSLLTEARGLLLQAAGSRDLSSAQQSRMREVAWTLAPCTCGKGSVAKTHTAECLNGPIYVEGGS